MLRKLLYFLLSAIWVARIFVNCDVSNEGDDGFEYIVGIDLGTTYSCVAVYLSGRVEIVPDREGKRITPSYVTYDEEGRPIIGMAAKELATKNVGEIYFDIKRIIGRTIDEDSVKKDMKGLPFKIKAGPNGKDIRVITKVGAEDQLQRPEQISSKVLSKLKDAAEDYIGSKVSKAVLTVPAYFNDNQRQSTRDAGILAGLNIVRIINEPTAAALAYGLDKKMSEEQNILVFDLGGGTFDVSLLTLDGGVFEVLSTDGDTHLGGQDFDVNTASYILKHINKTYNVKYTEKSVEYLKLRLIAEQAKRQLSVKTHVDIELDMVSDELSGVFTLTRAKFEELNMDLFKKTLIPIKKVLDDAEMEKNGVSEILLVGGSTRIPKIKELIKEFFDNKEPLTGVNPDEAVAYGAAIQGSIMSGAAEQSLLLLDVTSLSIGIGTAGNVLAVIVKKGTAIPTKKSQIFTTYEDNQTKVLITVYEGERAVASENNLLGSATLEGIPPAPKGQPQIEVTFEVDVSGIVTITAVELATQKSVKISLKKKSQNMKQEEIDAILREAEKHKDEDNRHIQTNEARSECQNYVYQLEKVLVDKQKLSSMLDESEIETLESKTKDTKNLLTTHPDASAEQYREWKLELENVAGPLMTKLHASTGKTPDTSEDEEL